MTITCMPLHIQVLRVRALVGAEKYPIGGTKSKTTWKCSTNKNSPSWAIALNGNYVWFASQKPRFLQHFNYIPPAHEPQVNNIRHHCTSLY